MKLEGDEERPPDRLVAVLIGEAQEGKTSLALRLLGAHAKDYNKLYSVLRGRRPYGKSATQVATIYEATGEEMTEKCLALIKNEVDKAWNTRPKPDNLHLRLPLNGDLAATVVDLVGLGPREEEEREQARELAKKWLYLADLLIYVCRVDHISNLTPPDYRIKEIMDRWRIDKDTAIFAITYAYELHSKREILTSINHPEELFAKAQSLCQESLVKQFSQEEKDITANNLPLVLPLCLKYGGKTEPIIEATEYGLGIIKRLVSDNPIRFRVRAGFTYPKQLEEKIRQDRVTLRKRAKEIRVKKKEWQDKLEKIKKRIRYREELVNDLEKQLKEIRGLDLTGLPVRISSSFSSKIRRFSIPWKEGKRRKKVKQLQTMANDFVDKINKAFYDACKRVDKEIPREIETGVKGAFQKVRRGLHKYLIGRIGRVEKGDVIVKGLFGGVKWKESHQALSDWARRTKEGSEKKVVEGLKTYLLPILKKESSKKKAWARKLEGSLMYAKKSLENLVKELQEKESDFKEWMDLTRKEQDKLKGEIYENRQKLKKAREYRCYIAEGFRVFWNKEVSKMNEEKDPVKILNILACLKEAESVLEELVVLKREKEETPWTT